MQSTRVCARVNHMCMPCPTFVRFALTILAACFRRRRRRRRSRIASVMCVVSHDAACPRLPIIPRVILALRRHGGIRLRQR